MKLTPVGPLMPRFPLFPSGPKAPGIPRGLFKNFLHELGYHYEVYN